MQIVFDDYQGNTWEVNSDLIGAIRNNAPGVANSTIFFTNGNRVDVNARTAARIGELLKLIRGWWSAESCYYTAREGFEDGRSYARTDVTATP